MDLDDVRREIARMKSKYGADKAARMVGCNRKTLWRWEAGRSHPSPLAVRVLRSVADAPKTAD